MSADPQRSRPSGGPSPPPRPALAGLGLRLLVFVAILFFLNYWLASRYVHEPPRIRIPYSPTFLSEVRDANVARITSKGTAVQGDFRKTVRYPAKGKKGS